jgi:tetratricopeptide (TPR) repeat protein
MRARRYREAAASFERAIAIDPKSAAAYARLGKARYRIGDTASAIGALIEAVRLQPDNVAYRIALGDAFRSGGEPWFAAECYKDAVALDPSNEKARSKLEALSQEPEATTGERPPQGPSLKQGKVRRKTYGGVLGLTYFLAPFVAGGLSAATDSAAGMVFLLSPPVVHLSYGNPGGAGVSLLGMVGSSALGCFVGFGIEMASTDSGTGSGFRGLAGAALGTLVGYTAWAIFDSAVLAYSEEPVERAARRAPRITAGLAPLPGGAMGAVGGTF